MDDLYDSASLYVDANVLIYLVEKHSDYHAALKQLFVTLAARDSEIVTSALTLSECMQGAIRRGNSSIIEAYERFFDRPSEPLRVVPVSEPILWAAAQVAVDFKLDLPDAIHFATALDLGCESFLTNDKGFTDGEPFPLVYRLADLV